MPSGRVRREIDAELVERATRAAAPAGRQADAVKQDDLRAFLPAEVIDTVRTRNRGADPEQVAALGQSELKAWRAEQQHVEP